MPRPIVKSLMIATALCASVSVAAAQAIYTTKTSRTADGSTTYTKTSPHGTTTVEVTRNAGGSISGRFTYQPRGPSYQPMGAGGYKPMGNR